MHHFGRGSVLSATPQELAELHGIVHSMGRTKSIYARVSNTHVKPYYTKDRSVVKGWQMLCSGANFSQVAQEYGHGHLMIRFRQTLYEYRYPLNGYRVRIASHSLDTLINKLRKRMQIGEAPQSRNSFMHGIYSHNAGNTYSGNCYKIYVMYPLRFITPNHNSYPVVIPKQYNENGEGGGQMMTVHKNSASYQVHHTSKPHRKPRHHRPPEQLSLMKWIE